MLRNEDGCQARHAPGERVALTIMCARGDPMASNACLACIFLSVYQHVARSVRRVGRVEGGTSKRGFAVSERAAFSSDGQSSEAAALQLIMQVDTKVWFAPEYVRTGKY